MPIFEIIYEVYETVTVVTANKQEAIDMSKSIMKDDNRNWRVLRIDEVNNEKL